MLLSHYINLCLQCHYLWKLEVKYKQADEDLRKVILDSNVFKLILLSLGLATGLKSSARKKTRAYNLHFHTVGP